MVKIFRRARQNLLAKGQVKRYFLYAIGEILLVMIGILLALQVNNWNQERVNNNKELKALSDLSKEFKLNQERIQAKQTDRIELSPRLKTYIQAVANGEADYTDFNALHVQPLLFGMTNPSNGVIDALISSGEIALISNDSLKYYLADWKNQLENLLENEQILWDSGIAYFGTTTGIIPFPSHEWTDWPAEKLEATFQQLSQNLIYRNALVGFEGTNFVVIQECASLLNKLEKVVALIELEKKKYPSGRS